MAGIYRYTVQVDWEIEPGVGAVLPLYYHTETDRDLEDGVVEPINEPKDMSESTWKATGRLHDGTPLDLRVDTSEAAQGQVRVLATPRQVQRLTEAHRHGHDQTLGIYQVDRTDPGEMPVREVKGHFVLADAV
jgi:hypothetical protein